MNRFYDSDATTQNGTLSAEESRHCALILRHQVGDKIVVMNGKGGVFLGELTTVSKTACSYDVLETIAETATKKDFSIHLLIAPTKNADRMEWLVEKLVEIGVDKMTFIATQNSERRKLRLDRLQKKAISAMKQSGNPHLIELQELRTFKESLRDDGSELKLITHVDPLHPYITDITKSGRNTSILIGPEGDFTSNELHLALESGFQPVSLGQNTLRTETAGFMACCSVNIINGF